MKEQTLDSLMQIGLSLQYCKLVLFLGRNNGRAYTLDVVEQTGLSRSFVERAPDKHPKFFSPKAFKSRPVSGPSRPMSTGIALTKHGRELETLIQSI